MKWSLGWRPEPGNFSQKGEKTCLHFNATARNLKPKTKYPKQNFFKI